MADRYTKKDLKIVASAKDIRGRSKMDHFQRYEAVREFLSEFEEVGIIKMKKYSKAGLFKELANPNDKGISDIVCVDAFVGKYGELRFGNGGSWSRFDKGGLLAREYKMCTVKTNGKCRFSWKDPDEDEVKSIKEEIKLYREEHHSTLGKGHQSIQLIKLCGTTTGSGRPINARIKAYFKDKPCVVCGTNNDTEVDHKNGLYNDPRVLDVKTQKISDFQRLCRHCNSQKRQTIKGMEKTGVRYPATNIPALSVFGISYTSGDETYDPEDVNWGVGTYWYDPVEFMRNIKILKSL